VLSNKVCALIDLISHLYKVCGNLVCLCFQIHECRGKALESTSSSLLCEDIELSAQEISAILPEYRIELECIHFVEAKKQVDSAQIGSYLRF
jgi:hypothetical protein